MKIPRDKIKNDWFGATGSDEDKLDAIFDFVESEAKITRTEFIELLDRLKAYVAEDRVTASDDLAMLCCDGLAGYAADHMTDEDFVQQSPMWRSLA